jgi:transcriptional regulator with XRE-family HTH domain
MAASFNQQWVAVMSQGLSQDEKAYFKALGARIAQRRKEAGLTQVQLAEALGIAQQTYASYETGFRRVPVSSLPTLAQTLKVEIDILLGAPAKTRGSGKRGPAPKFQHHIERISQLSKPKQRFVLEMLETVLAQQSR